ncbi:cholesterol 7-desaturase nvd-like [Sycon ciliatum]|uniref:cholesterol 7-desaturase nvd-like n=1 Tax=Sycon ciliatum TaxID=27933 RepID=UPI0020ABBAFE|eukprot:scpid78766/ scgid23962/ 3-ketosteroid-9-alpha-monooxygenase oxygenase subunit; 3-ketosteroid-9-alpha-hydroxylase oxygenase subunit; Rieske-type oxygenase
MATLTVLAAVGLIVLALADDTLQETLADNLRELPLPSFVGIQLVDSAFIQDTWQFFRREALQKRTFWVLAAVLVAYELYKLLVKPLRVVRRLEDRGYVPDQDESTLKDTAADVARRRQRGDLPPVYPNGWFRICDSGDLAIGEVKTFTLLGESIAVFRGENGTVYAVEAYCPHLGANLGIGGRVIDNCIECPFHGWTFRGDDGKCVRIPYAKKVPEIAKIKPWTILEVNKLIYIWHHAEKCEPDYLPEEIEGIVDGSWRCHGFSEHMINAHIQEVPENAADVAHLSHLHGPFLIQGVDLRYTNKPSVTSALRHGWSAEWSALPAPEAHIGVLNLSHYLTVFGFRVPGTTIDVEARQIGPSIVHLHFDHCIFGKGVLLQELSPVEPLLLKMTHQVWGSPWMPSFIGKLFLWGEYHQVERDLMIWNNKRYVSKPMLVKEDELIGKHRRWYSQFYSENSPRYTAARTSLDW